MKNVTTPLQRVSTFGQLIMSPDRYVWKRLEMAPNEFSSQEDYIGLFPQEPTTTKFLSLQRESTPSNIPATDKTASLTQPRAILEIVISN